MITHIGPYPKIIPLKFFLDTVPGPSAYNVDTDITWMFP